MTSWMTFPMVKDKIILNSHGNNSEQMYGHGEKNPLKNADVYSIITKGWDGLQYISLKKIDRNRYIRIRLVWLQTSASGIVPLTPKTKLNRYPFTIMGASDDWLRWLCLHCRLSKVNWNEYPSECCFIISFEASRSSNFLHAKRRVCHESF